MNYREYSLNRKEWVIYSGQAVLLTGAAAFCFYDSFWFFLILPFFLPLYLRNKKKELADKRRKELKLQFRDAVQSIAAALAAGYSAENALKEAGRDLEMMYSRDMLIVQELAAMQRKLDSNRSIEEVMMDFAERSGLSEAEVFAEIFSAAKRNGGDLIGIMKNTARTISETVDTERQAAAFLASRKYEQTIMNRIPFLIILYLRMGSSGFLDPLYGNILGICVMTVCLGICIFSGYLGKRLLKIEV